MLARRRSAALAACTSAFLSLGSCAVDPNPRRNELEVRTMTSGTDLDPDGYRVEVHDAGGILRNEAIGVNDGLLIQIYLQNIFDVLLTDIAPNCSPAVNPQQAFAPSWRVEFNVSCVANVGALDLSVTTQGTAYKNAFELTFDW